MNIKSVNSVNSLEHWFFSVLVTRVYVNICILPLKWKSYFWIEGGLHKYRIYRARFYATELALIYRITRQWEKLLREKLESTFQRRWQRATTESGSQKKCTVYTVYCSIEFIKVAWYIELKECENPTFYKRYYKCIIMHKYR